MKTLTKAFAGLCSLLAIATAAVWLSDIESDPLARLVEPPLAATSTAERGLYLAQIGNCAGCHTARGGQAYAGGQAIQTPFGNVFASNLTPDAATGLGKWTRADFWQAMHHGKSKDSRMLYPAFPYTSYTQVSREDSDALFAYLQSLPSIAQVNLPATLRFPYNSQAALAVWRALYFRPGSYQANPSQSADWNRGAYLTEGLGHCSACHAARNALGATDGLNLAGGLIPVQNWYAPSLVAPQEAGLQNWRVQDIKTLFKTGMTAQASVNGPMAEVVLGSTQHWKDADLNAMAVFLKALPPSGVTPASAPQDNATTRGAKLYEQHCAQCHGDDGKGIPNAYPALAGNRAVQMSQTTNLVQLVLNGGYAPATQGNPRPFGMPPFVLVLSDADVAEVLTHIRRSWGNHSGSLSAFDVNRVRTSGAQ